MSTWASMYRGIKGGHYNVRNAPVQPLHPNTLQSWGHYGHLIFTNNYMPNQSWPDTCHLPGQLHPKGLRRDLLMALRTSAQVDIDQTSDQTGPLLLSETAPSCKTSNVGVLMIMVLAKINAWGGASSGNSLRPSSRIPNSNKISFSCDVCSFCSGC
jgi:hypothetical protein